MLSLKSEIGRSVGPFYETVTLEQMVTFAKAVGLPETQIAPPTFMTVFRQGEFELLRLIGVQLSQILHAEQEYEYIQNLSVGDQIRIDSKLSHVAEKQTSSVDMQFLTFETCIHIEGKSAESLAGKARSLIVIRTQKK